MSDITCGLCFRTYNDIDHQGHCPHDPRDAKGKPSAAEKKPDPPAWIKK